MPISDASCAHDRQRKLSFSLYTSSAVCLCCEVLYYTVLLHIVLYCAPVVSSRATTVFLARSMKTTSVFSFTAMLNLRRCSHRCAAAVMLRLEATAAVGSCAGTAASNNSACSTASAGEGLDTSGSPDHWHCAAPAVISTALTPVHGTDPCMLPCHTCPPSTQHHQPITQLRSLLTVFQPPNCQPQIANHQPTSC